jgi:hypothetical protein
MSEQKVKICCEKRCNNTFTEPGAVCPSCREKRTYLIRQHSSLPNEFPTSNEIDLFVYLSRLTRTKG